MNILGLGYTQHECSAALVVDGELRTAIARERVSRIKRDGSAWGSARLDLGSDIDYCLQANNLMLDNINLIVYNDYYHRSAEDFRSRLGVCRTFPQTKSPHFPLLAGVLSAALSLGAERP